MEFNDLFNNLHSASDTQGISKSEDVDLDNILCFLANGYAVEYIIVNQRKKVLRFIDPDQFLLRISDNTSVDLYGNIETVNITFDDIVIMLRKFPEETVAFHKKIKLDYLEKLQLYKDDLKKTAAERYLDLLENKPWVMQLIEPEVIASYLNLSKEQYDMLILSIRNVND
ncbi:hypothetical protein [Pedobacter nyackensis]|nr:hypothetical protein [Pedobacter nyackensis]